MGEALRAEMDHPEFFLYPGYIVNTTKACIIRDGVAKHCSERSGRCAPPGA